MERHADAVPTAPATPPVPASRFLRLRAYEILIFVVLAILMAICLTVAPAIAQKAGDDGRVYGRSGSPPT